MKVLDRMDRSRGRSQEENIILDQVRRVSQSVIAPNAARYDESGAFPWDNIKALNELGLNAIFIPEEVGGCESSFRLYLSVVQTVAEACASTGIIYATNFHAMKPLIDFGTDAQKRRLLPRVVDGALASLAITETAAGSDAAGMKTRFTPDGDHIVIDGEKIFITSGNVANLILLFGKWSEIDDPRRAISVLVLETPAEGFSIGGIEDKMGHRASSTAALTFSGCRAPRANLLGNPGDGLPILLASLNKSRPSVAAHALGIATAAFKEMVGYMNQRQQSGRRIIEFQGNQFMLADLACELAMAECWLDHVARLIDAGETDFGIEASMAKLRSSDLAMRMTTEAVQMFGGYGYCKPSRVERLMRDAKVTQIWEGTNQIHRQLIGRSLRQG